MSEMVERAIALLTRSQREAVWWCNADGSPRQWAKGAPARVSFYVLKSITKGDPRHGIAETFKVMIQGNGTRPVGHIWPEQTWALTPFGIAIRAALAPPTSAGQSGEGE